MALGTPPQDLAAEVTADGAKVRLRGWSIAVNEWEVVLEEPRLFGGPRRRVVPLPELLRMSVSGASRSADHYALLLSTDDETIVVAAGADEEHLLWVAAAIQEAEHTRARREGAAGREYLFDRVVPGAVTRLLDRE